MTSETRPAHSPLGASSAERWMNCPGSVKLIQTVTLPESDESEYAREGTAAHAMAAWCLEEGQDAWVAVLREPDWTPEMADAVQIYLDEVRGLTNDKTIAHFEYRVSSARHPLFYGTVDAAVLDGNCLHIRDFKYGAGVVVEVEDNPQILYYAYGMLQHFPAVEHVTVGIVQPRAHHPDGHVRVAYRTAVEVREWAEHVLFPAMDNVAIDQSLDPGAWCRFCPAKLVCPALTGLFGAAAKVDTRTVVHMGDEQLDREYDKLAAVKMYVAALEKRVLERLEAGAKMQYAKLVLKKANRVWRENAEEELAAKLGFDKIYETKMKSPPGIEDLGPSARKLVKEYAYTPNTGYTVAHVLDSRLAVTKPQAEEVYAHVIAGGE